MLPLWPTINASLNALAGLCLFLGFMAIRRKNQLQHRFWMISAMISSTLFLICYLYYHFTSAGITRYQGQGLMRGIYFTILKTHTPLAVFIVPFILIAFNHALKGRYEQHKKLTKWVYPLWMYVSITGVLIYLMLYIFPTA